ncbi:acyl-CoA 6-desaturase-like [Saccoglossus kowalevskii]|uniref:Fatty acid desaturase 2-like n=1 Tax=Saccoglossus kowalevskii TaxID=10224 RepID=A0ABM0MRN3_SACKO|nr:PREDICTED: fatty acid desaturase 2-like [Saccoglossus kowalevskii]
MGKGGDDVRNGVTRTFTRKEVEQHNQRSDQWVVVNHKVYDITEWCHRHPGGRRVISHYAGEDATEPFTAFHPDKVLVGKFLKPLYLGDLCEEDQKLPEIVEDFRNLRKEAEEMSLFEANMCFFSAHLGHILLLEFLGWFNLWYFGTGWVPYMVTAFILTTMQAQAGWLQHDLGHLSVFKTSTLNHWAHKFVIGGLKAASATWWNFRHFQHHAKPNIVTKDPDVQAPYLFLLGDKMPQIWGKRKKGFMPYNWQQDYFFLLGPPLLLPIDFHIENLRCVFKWRLWNDLAWTVFFFIRFFAMYTPLLGGWGAFGLYMFVRFIESHWFVWVTQMNHIPMDIDKESHKDWLTLQLQATCNVDQSFFNDWFTGHLNFQIEHHLYPTMPRHNYHKIAPLCKSLCQKHGLKYESKSLGTAFVDIVRSLKKSGELWYEAYYYG